MFIKVVYGYKQGSLFNLNCQTGPLLDAVKRQAFTDITSLITSRQSQFSQEIESINKKIESKQKKLLKLENPEEETKNPTILPKRAVHEENKEPAKQEQFLLASEEQAKEEAKKAATKPQPTKKEDTKKGKKQVEEVKELTPEEIKQKKLDAEKEDLRNQIIELTRRKEIMGEKLKMLQIIQEKYLVLPKDIDFIDPVGARKYLGGRIEDNASTLLNNRTIYQLNIVDTENSATPYEIDGFCIRTLEEDATYVEEPDPKTKGKAKPLKKK